MTAAEGAEQRCVTCSDEGREGRIVRLGRVGGEGRLPGPALVQTACGTEEVDLALVPGARPGDAVLIHAGLAIAVVEAPRAAAGPA